MSSCGERKSSVANDICDSARASAARLGWQSSPSCAATRQLVHGATRVPAARSRWVLRGKTDDLALAVEPALVRISTKRGRAESEIASHADSRIRRRRDCIGSPSTALRIDAEARLALLIRLHKLCGGSIPPHDHYYH